MRIIEQNNLFYIIFKYRPFIVDAVKALPERRFDYVNKQWTVPVSQRPAVESFARRFGFKMNATAQPKPAVKPVYKTPALPDLKFHIPLKMDLFPFQRKGVAYNLTHKRVIIGDQPGLGKSQPLTAKIATPNGWKTMGELLVGDDIFNSEGDIQFVEAVYPQGKRPVYKVTLNDGFSTECDEEHLWSVRDGNRRKRGTGWAVKSVKEILSMGITEHASEYRLKTGRKPILKFEIPLTKPVNYPAKNYVIDPYIMGMLLGDGSLSAKDRKPILISIPDSEYESVLRIETLLPKGLKLRANRHGQCPQYAITQNRTTNPNPVKEEIKELGLNVKGESKFIPEIYLQGSIEQRLELLRGLMDSDGSISKNRVAFHSVCYGLVEGISELVQSLGGQTIIREYDRSKEGKKTEWQVNVRMDENPFSLSRKALKWKPAKRNYANRRIKSIEYIGEKECQCIKVSSPDNLYLTDNYIVTHNTAQAIATITGAGAFPCLVICPASLKLNWQREWHMWTDRKAMLLSDKNKDTWHMFTSAENNIFRDKALADVFIVNYESLKKYFVSKIEKPEGVPLRLNHIRFNAQISLFQSIIIDESHRVKDTRTQQTKFTKGICTGKEWILALTGTPVVNKPFDLVSQLGIIDQLGRLGGFKRFVDRYCEGGDGHSNEEELNYMLNKTCFYRREKKDVLSDLPDKMRQVVLCDINTRKEYTDALNDLETYLVKYRQATDEQVQRSMRGEVMVKIGVLKNISARGKLADVCEYVNDIIESGEKLVLFTHLRDVQQKIWKKFPGAVTIFGDDNGPTRQMNVDKFQKDPKVKLIICSIKAAGVGITLTASSRVAFVELPWHPADTEQCEDRCHRIGQKDSVQAIYFLGKNTIDEWIYQIINEKRNVSDKITGAKNQVEESVMDGVINLFNQKK